MDEGADSLMADQLITGTTLVEKESRSIGDAPIGSILAWAKSLAGVPNLAEGWVECDGSVLSDALSPLNGQTIPNLNGDNRFLRGNSTSGGTGGSATASHRHNSEQGSLGFTSRASSSDALILPSNDTSNDLTVISTSAGTISGNTITGRTDLTAPENRPPFYDVVWIMRVR